MKLTDDVIRLLAYSVMKWAEREIGFKFGDTPEIDIRRFGMEKSANVQITVDEMGRELSFFLKKLQVNFEVGINEHSTPGKGGLNLIVWNIGINFERKNGGTNGWDSRARFECDFMDEHRWTERWYGASRQEQER